MKQENKFLQKDELGIANSLFQELFPINRSIAGSGLRKSLKILSKFIKMDINEIKSGKECFGWEVPNEWEVNEAYIKDRSGKKIVDFKNNNLHLISFSSPFNGSIKGNELKKNLFFLPDRPNSIPYRTSYYEENWGFCITKDIYDSISDYENYEVLINTTKTKGFMSMGIANLKSNVKDAPTYLISSYLCHPSLANDNLSGPILSILLWRRLAQMENLSCNWTLQISPETIGALAWLDQFKETANNLEGVIVCTTCAGKGKLGYKDSFNSNSKVSRAVRLASRDLNEDLIYYPFVPDGSDERQFSSPGFRIPTISITKDKYYEYKEYHNSDDNLKFATPENLLKSLEFTWQVVKNLEYDCQYERFNKFGETRLGIHGLYPNISGHVNSDSINEELKAFGWLDWIGDGSKSLMELSEEKNIKLEFLSNSLDKLVNKKIGKKIK